MKQSIYYELVFLTLLLWIHTCYWNFTHPGGLQGAYAFDVSNPVSKNNKMLTIELSS